MCGGDTGHFQLLFYQLNKKNGIVDVGVPSISANIQRCPNTCKTEESTINGQLGTLAGQPAQTTVPLGTSHLNQHQISE